MAKCIAFVKTGWSDDYAGGSVVGRHADISKKKADHERFNFLKAPDEQFYAYIPPIGRNYRPPQPREKDDWLLIFVSARNGNGPLTVVGWYEHAVFESEYCERPEYALDQRFETDFDGNKYIYCIKSGVAKLIPAESREIVVPGDHLRQSPIIYVRGNGKNDDWRQEFAVLAEEISSTTAIPAGEAKPYLRFPDQEHRIAVEKASIEAAVKYLEGKGNGYKITDRQRDDCGYDLLAKRASEPTELHIEVKGTSSNERRFFMTRNEKRQMPNREWRLIIVTDALENPRISLLTESKVKELFQFNALVWEASLK